MQIRTIDSDRGLNLPAALQPIAVAAWGEQDDILLVLNADGVLYARRNGEWYKASKFRIPEPVAPKPEPAQSENEGEPATAEGQPAEAQGQTNEGAADPLSVAELTRTTKKKTAAPETPPAE